MKKKLIFIASIFLFSLLVACNRNETPDTSTFNLAPDLIVNSELDGLVTMQIEIESRTMKELIENKSDFLIGLWNENLEYFDGENWRVVPTQEDFAFTAILEMIADNDSFESRLNLDWYQAPRQGLFRWRRSIFPDLYPSQNRYIHDLIVEFMLD